MRLESVLGFRQCITGACRPALRFYPHTAFSQYHAPYTPPSRCLSVRACLCVCAHSYSTLFRHPFACQGPLPLSQLHAVNPLPHSQLSASPPHPVLRCLRGFFGASLVLSAPWLAFSRLVSLFRSLDFCLCPPPSFASLSPSLVARRTAFCAKPFSVFCPLSLDTFFCLSRSPPALPVRMPLWFVFRSQSVSRRVLFACCFLRSTLVAEVPEDAAFYVFRFNVCLPSAPLPSMGRPLRSSRLRSSLARLPRGEKEGYN